MTNSPLVLLHAVLRVDEQASDWDLERRGGPVPRVGDLVRLVDDGIGGTEVIEVAWSQDLSRAEVLLAMEVLDSSGELEVLESSLQRSGWRRVA